MLVGVDTETKEILYRNPTLKDHICYMSFSSLEEARTSYGTDEDLIFVTDRVKINQPIICNDLN